MHFLADESYDMVVLDPPYSAEEAEEFYWTPPPRWGIYTREAVRVCRVGGHVAVYLDRQPARSVGTRLVHRIVVLTRTWHTPRVLLRVRATRDMTARPTPSARLAKPDALLSRGDLRELGLERRAVDAVFRACPVVVIPGYSRPMIRVADYLELIAANTYAGDRVRNPRRRRQPAFRSSPFPRDAQLVRRGSVTALVLGA